MSNRIKVVPQSFIDSHSVVKTHIKELERLKQELSNAGTEILRNWNGESSRVFDNVNSTNQRIFLTIINELDRLNDDMLEAGKKIEDADKIISGGTR